VRAARALNRELLPLYWDIGKGIVEKQKALVGRCDCGDAGGRSAERLSQGEGFSARNLWDMQRLYLADTDAAILRQLVAELAIPRQWPHSVRQQ